jgi:hypothetical protein
MEGIPKAVPAQQSNNSSSAKAVDPAVLFSRPTSCQTIPIVNVFKQCDVETKKNVELAGKVASRMVGPAQCS